MKLYLKHSYNTLWCPVKSTVRSFNLPLASKLCTITQKSPEGTRKLQVTNNGSLKDLRVFAVCMINAEIRSVSQSAMWRKGLIGR